MNWTAIGGHVERGGDRRRWLIASAGLAEAESADQGAYLQAPLRDVPMKGVN